MKLSWKLFGAFYFPLHLAFGSFYVSGMVLGEKADCRGLCMISDSDNCAEFESLLLSDFIVYAGIVFIALSFVLPAIALYREKKIIQTSIFN